MSTYCSLPFIHLATHPHGGATLCCVSDFTNSMNSARNFVDDKPVYLNLNKNSVVEIMNSDYYRQVRNQMLTGEKPQACMRCYREEENGVRSKRIEENEKLGFTEDMARAITQADGTIPVNFKFVELRLGNLCNVKCRTCNPASSTSWAQEYKKLQQELKFVTQYNVKIDASWTESEEFWEDLLEHSKEVELLYINGGEPTLVEKHWHYLQRLIDVGLNKQITLWYNINMTNLPDKLLEIWKQFKAVEVSCSIDDLGERNEYIRTGTKWDTVISNLDKLQSLPWIKTSVCQTVSIYNIATIHDFHAYMKMRGLHVHHNFVYDPVFLSAANLPANEKMDIISSCEISGTFDAYQILSIKNYLTPQDNSEKLEHFKKYNVWLDSERKTYDKK